MGATDWEIVNQLESQMATPETLEAFRNSGVTMDEAIAYLQAFRDSVPEETRREFLAFLNDLMNSPTVTLL